MFISNALIASIIRKRLPKMVFLLVLAVTLVLTSVVTVDIGRRLVDILSNSKLSANIKLHHLATHSSAMLCVALVTGGINYFLCCRYGKFSQHLVGEIRASLFSHLLHLPQEFYNKNSVGHINSRLTSEVGYIGNFFAKMFLQPVINLVTVIFYSVYIFSLDWKMALAGLILLPLNIVVLPRINKRIQRLTEENVIRNGAFSTYLNEVFTGINDVRGCQTYAYEEARLGRRLNDCIDVSLSLGQSYAVLESVTKTVSQLAPLSLYVAGGILCIKGQMTVGSLVASIAVINSLYTPVTTLVNFVLEWKQVKVRFSKLEEYLRLQPEKGGEPGFSDVELDAPDISFRNVRFGFPGEELLLNDISFNTPYGNNVAFVGTSGSGKSLTVTLLNGIYKPVGGRITFQDHESDALGVYNVRSAIGYVNQTPFLFNDSIRNNILYGLFRKRNRNLTSNEPESWIDYSLVPGVASLADLEERVIQIAQDVGLGEDLYRLGLKVRSSDTELVGGIEKSLLVQARIELRASLSGEDAQYIEFYQEANFMEFCSLLENLLFVPSKSIKAVYGSVPSFVKEVLLGRLKAEGLLYGLFAIGLRIAQLDNEVLEKLRNNQSPLLNKLPVDHALVSRKLDVVAELTSVAETVEEMLEKNGSLFVEIIAMALEHVPGTSKEELVDDGLRAAVLTFRNKALADAQRGALPIQPFRYNEYMDALTLEENILFGNINPLRRRAADRIRSAVRELLAAYRLEILVLKLGLDFNVGERGGKLSGGQRQKIAIARILLKNPSVLILDEATAALDSASQARITDVVREQFSDKTVFSIAHRLNIIKDYDHILVFDKGRIVQSGNFESLLEEEGLFRKLYEGSN